MRFLNMKKKAARQRTFGSPDIASTSKSHSNLGTDLDSAPEDSASLMKISMSAFAALETKLALENKKKEMNTIKLSTIILSFHRIISSINQWSHHLKNVVLTVVITAFLFDMLQILLIMNICYKNYNESNLTLC